MESSSTDQVQTGKDEQEQATPNCLDIIQQLSAEGRITEDQKDDLKDMVFEDDSKLIGLLMRYSETHELEELKNKIVEYISTQTQDISNEFKQYQTEKATEEQPAATESLDGMWSPGDSMLEMKKRQRRLAQQKAAAEKKKQDDALSKKKEKAIVDLAECELGASPQLRSGLHKGGSKFSPLSMARGLELPSKQGKQQKKSTK